MTGPLDFDPHRDAEEGHSLWGGRFGERMADAMVGLNRSLDVDFRLWPQDIRASQAWSRALSGAGVLTEVEAAEIVAGLERVGDRLSNEPLQGEDDEDIHSLVERLLREEIGSLAGKLHTGRSRNDQVATDFRLWGMEAARQVRERLTEVLRGLLALAESGMDILVPGYTHLQQAQPIRASHWALSHFWPLVRDRDRWRAAADAAGVLPLGSGALAGCPFPVDRSWLAEQLGFRSVAQNSLDAVSDRDWAAEMAFAGALAGVHLSRLGEDLVLFSSREFALLELADAYSTGSSLMPQKKNPDVAELVRGKSARLLGNLQGVLTLLKGLPTGYNRDLQEDKPLLFDTVDTLLLSLPALAGGLATARFREGKGSKGMDPMLLATDLADHLVRQGVPFRDAHHAVGLVVKAAETSGVSILHLSRSDLQALHPSFQDAASEILSFESSVEARSVSGGTARIALEAQIEQARRAVGQT
jgi:argininosuccinate lyase